MSGSYPLTLLMALNIYYNNPILINNHHQFHISIFMLLPFSYFLGMLLPPFVISDPKSDRSIKPFSSLLSHFTYFIEHLLFHLHCCLLTENLRIHHHPHSFLKKEIFAAAAVLGHFGLPLELSVHTLG